MIVSDELPKQEKSIYRRFDSLLRDIRDAGLCIFVNGDMLEIYRGNKPPQERVAGGAIMSFWISGLVYD